MNRRGVADFTARRGRFKTHTRQTGQVRLIFGAVQPIGLGAGKPCCLSGCPRQSTMRNIRHTCGALTGHAINLRKPRSSPTLVNLHHHNVIAPGSHKAHGTVQSATQHERRIRTHCPDEIPRDDDGSDYELPDRVRTCGFEKIPKCMARIWLMIGDMFDPAAPAACLSI